MKDLNTYFNKNSPTEMNKIKPSNYILFAKNCAGLPCGCGIKLVKPLKSWSKAHTRVHYRMRPQLLDELPDNSTVL